MTLAQKPNQFQVTATLFLQMGMINPISKLNHIIIYSIAKVLASK